MARNSPVELINDVESTGPGDVNRYVSELGHGDCDTTPSLKRRMAVQQPPPFSFIAEHQRQAENRDIGLKIPRPRCIQVCIQEKPAIQTPVLLRNILLVRVVVRPVRHEPAVSPEFFERRPIVYPVDDCQQPLEKRTPGLKRHRAASELAYHSRPKQP